MLLKTGLLLQCANISKIDYCAWKYLARGLEKKIMCFSMTNYSQNQ